MAKEQLFTYNDIQDLIEDLKRITADSYVEETNISWENLKNSAVHFLTQIQILETQNIMNKYKRLGNLVFNGSSVSARTKANQNSSYIIRAKYALAFDFDAKLNNYLNGLPKKALYIYRNSHGQLETYEMSLQELASKAGHKGRLNLSLSSLQSEQRKSLEDAMKDDKDLAEHLVQVRAAYLGVTNRLARFKATHPSSSSQGGLLMWNMGGTDWVVARVINAGDLSEAYVSALMVKHKTDLDILCNQDRGEPEYYSHSLIATFFNNYISSVSNMAAIREEDVITDRYQYAVKARKSELPSLQQYLDAANFIINSELLNPEQLKAEIVAMFPYDIHRNKVLGVVNSEADLTIDEILKQLKTND